MTLTFALNDTSGALDLGRRRGLDVIDTGGLPPLHISISIL